jgi:putative transposase
MPKGLKRIYGGGDRHFVTFSCYHRLPLLASAQAQNLVAKELGIVRQEYGFPLVGYVVILTHVHILMGEPKKGTPSTVLQMLKQRVSRKLRSADLSLEKNLPKLWQDRFYDFNVYSYEKRKEKLEYMDANPVKGGLVDRPEDWIWSSYLFYEKGQPGLVEIDPVD